MRRFLPLLAAAFAVAFAVGLAVTWFWAGPAKVQEAPARRPPEAPPARTGPVAPPRAQPPAKVEPADLGEVRPPAPPVKAPPEPPPAEPPAKVEPADPGEATVFQPPAKAPPAVKAPEPEVRYEDPVPVAPRLPPEDWTGQDVTAVADQLGAELAAWAARLPEAAKDAPKPKVLVLPFKNRTDRHIAYREIAGRLEAAAAKPGRIEFLGGEVAEALAKEYGLMASGMAKPEGRKFGADYVLAGQIDSLAVRKGDAKVTHYYLVLSLMDMGSGERVWRAEREIVKQPKEPAK